MCIPQGGDGDGGQGGVGEMGEAGSRGNQGLLSLTGLHLDGLGRCIVCHLTNLNQSIISPSLHHQSISSALHPPRTLLGFAA